MALLDCIFPPRCAGCRRLGIAWCSHCADTVRAVPARLLSGVPLIAAGRLDGAWQQALHTYKYSPRPQLAARLALVLCDVVRRAGVRLDGLASVPLHPARLKERGFDQADDLALQLASQLSLPVFRGLERRRNTSAQVGLTGSARRQNVEGAFRWSALRPPSSALGLVDDVCTTGATLRAAAAAIRAAGGGIAAFFVLATPTALADDLATAQTLVLAPVTSPE